MTSAKDQKKEAQNTTSSKPLISLEEGREMAVKLFDRQQPLRTETGKLTPKQRNELRILRERASNLLTKHRSTKS